MGEWSYADLKDWFFNHPRWTFLIIILSIAYIYNNVFRFDQRTLRQSLVFHLRALRMRKFAATARSFFIYFLIAVGALMLVFFQLMGLPIIPSLGIALGLMWTVRIRYWIQSRGQKQE
jgi:hypothetical protein